MLFRVDFNRWPLPFPFTLFPLIYTRTDFWTTLQTISFTLILSFDCLDTLNKKKLTHIDTHLRAECFVLWWLQMWQILRKPSNLRTYTQSNQYTLVFRNQTSVPLPFYKRKMWPLIKNKSELDVWMQSLERKKKHITTVKISKITTER